jgi:hypothetical protein
VSAYPDVLMIYSLAELREYDSRIRANLKGMWEEDFISKLEQQERLRTGTVTLTTPLVGATRYPLEFYSNPAERQVVLPIASVKFLDDLALAYCYCADMGYDLGVVSDYAAVLRFRPGDIPGSPLDTLDVPRAAIVPPKVDVAAQNALKSTVFFVAAHEYGHVMYQHKDYGSITAPEAQRQEADADAFALEILRRIGVVPVGLVYFFLTASRLEATPADFASPADYENFLRTGATHPVSAMRLLDLAAKMEGNARAFARLQADVASWELRVKQEAMQLREIADTLDDRRMRIFVADRARTIDVSKLRVSAR